MKLNTRKTIGCALALAGVICCLCALTGGRRIFPDRYEASGRSGAFVRPAPPDGTIRVNEADAEELTALPGIGETLARAIIEERNAHGPFRYAEDLCAVKGIGSSTLARFRGMLDLSPPGEENRDDSKEP